MERIYTIEQHDNGWSVGDDTGASSVCEEKIKDTRHEKFRRLLGDLVYEELEYFIENNPTTKVRITMEFEETETDLTNNKTNES